MIKWESRDIWADKVIIKELLIMNKEFEAFTKTLSLESLKAIYDEAQIEDSESDAERIDTYSVAVASQMAVNLVEKYHAWLKENESK